MRLLIQKLSYVNWDYEKYFESRRFGCVFEKWNKLKDDMSLTLLINSSQPVSNLYAELYHEQSVMLALAPNVIIMILHFVY